MKTPGEAAERILPITLGRTQANSKWDTISKAECVLRFGRRLRNSDVNELTIRRILSLVIINLFPLIPQVSVVSIKLNKVCSFVREKSNLRC
jgi:hypothetical protein